MRVQESRVLAILSTRLRGSAATEYAILAGLSAALAASLAGNVPPAVTTLLGFGDDVGRRAGSARDAELASDGCMVWGELDDIGAPVEGVSCYRMSGGDDDFAGGNWPRDLVIDAGEGAGKTPSIATGTGSDRIVSSQGGAILSGGGNDAVSLSFQGLALAPVEIDLGPGDDVLDLDVLSTAPEASDVMIRLGTGRDDVTASCNRQRIHLDPGGEGRKFVRSACDLVISAPAETGLDLDVAATGDLVLLAEGVGPKQIAIDGSGAAPGSVHSVRVDLSALGHYAHRASGLDRADVSFLAPGDASGPAASVEVHLEARSGRILFDGISHASWTVAVEMPGDGIIETRWRGIGMEFPQLSGTIAELIVSGCLESLEFLDAAGTLIEALPSCAPAAAYHQVPAGAEILRLGRMSRTTDLRIGQGGLTIDHLRFGPLPEGLAVPHED